MQRGRQRGGRDRLQRVARWPCCCSYYWTPAVHVGEKMLKGRVKRSWEEDGFRAGVKGTQSHIATGVPSLPARPPSLHSGPPRPRRAALHPKGRPARVSRAGIPGLGPAQGATCPRSGLQVPVWDQLPIPVGLSGCQAGAGRGGRGRREAGPRQLSSPRGPEPRAGAPQAPRRGDTECACVCV